MSRRCRRLRLSLALSVLLAGAGSAGACDPDLIDAALEAAEAHLSFAVRAGDVDAARVHLRRAAHALSEAEAQFVSCNCQTAPYEAASAAAEARRAAGAQEFIDLVNGVEAAITGFQITVLAMQEDLCR